MTGFDFAIIGILLVSMLLGVWRGLIYEVMALLGWPLAFVASRLFVDDLVSLLPSMREQSIPPMVQDLSIAAASYALVFIAVLIAWAILTKLLSRLMKAAGVGWTDRVLGGLFGALRGGLVVLVLVWIVGLTNIFELTAWREALMTGTLEEAALKTRIWLPDVMAQRINYGS